MSLRQHIPSFEFEWVENKGSRVRYNGQPVANPILRVLVATVAIVAGMVAFVLGLLSFLLGPLMFVVMLLLAVILLPFHGILWGLGRNGFLFHDDDGLSITLMVNRYSFRRRNGTS